MIATAARTHSGEKLVAPGRAATEGPGRSPGTGDSTPYCSPAPAPALVSPRETLTTREPSFPKEALSSGADPWGQSDSEAMHPTEVELSTLV